MTVEFIGKLERSPYYLFDVDGYKVPYLYAYKHQENEFFIVLDDRLHYGPFTAEEVAAMLPVVANAMAIAAGFSCHGHNCKKQNPFTVRVGYLSNDNKQEGELND